MNELHLFAGAGGGILGGILSGHTTVCAVEIEPYPRKVLLQRQRDGILPHFPIWDDINTFDGNPWRGQVDIVAGGFPCQDISIAGRGVGITGKRSGLWNEMARVVGEVRPRFVFVENSPMLTARGLGRVLGDLAELGYNARWCVLGANDVGAPHRRKRIWILAYPNMFRCNNRGDNERENKFYENKDWWHCEGCEHGEVGWNRASKNNINTRAEQENTRYGDVQNKLTFTDQEKKLEHTDPNLFGCFQQQVKDRSPQATHDALGNPCSTLREHAREDVGRCRWWDIDPADKSIPIESRLGRVADGVVDRLDRIKAIGNGQVPLVAKFAWDILSDGLI